MQECSIPKMIWHHVPSSWKSLLVAEESFFEKSAEFEVETSLHPDVKWYQAVITSRVNRRYHILTLSIIIIIIVIIIITRPWPAFGRQGLVGSSGGYTYHGYTSHASPRACGARLGLQLWLGETKQNKTPWTLNLEHSNLPTFLPSSLPTFQPFIPTF